MPKSESKPLCPECKRTDMIEVHVNTDGEIVYYCKRCEHPEVRESSGD